MRNWMIAGASVLVMSTAVAAHAQSTTSPQAPATAAAHYSTASTTIGDILDDPAAKAVVVKILPDVIDNDQIDAARSMTLKDLQQYASDKITDTVLASIDAEFARLPAKK
jgi:para-nitrobenzyl esterase